MRVIFDIGRTLAWRLLFTTLLVVVMMIGCVSTSHSRRYQLNSSNLNSSNTGLILKWPAKGRVSSHFGWRNGRPHEGLDIAAKRGTKVYAAASGLVSFSARAGSYGNTVVIRHGSFRTVYAHLGKVSVRRGDRVMAGEFIGRIGMSGRTSGPHLHFEVRGPNGSAHDPIAFLDRNIPGVKPAKKGLLFSSASL